MSLVFDNISHAFGATEVLKGVSLDARGGEVTCLLGPSGSGKSTMLRLAAGLEAVQSGALRLDGDVLADASTHPAPEKRPVGLVFQDNALFPHMTIAANIGFGLPKEARTETVEAWLSRVDLAGFGKRYPHTLSGGQQQRVALARALAPAPQVLLMDEPYASIDSTLRRSMREAARLTLKASGAITLLVTHDPEEAMEMGDKIAVLDEGRILQQGKPQTLYDTPTSQSVAALFGGADTIDAQIAEGKLVTDFGTWPVPQEFDAGKGSAKIVARPAGFALAKVDDARVQIVDKRYVGGAWIAFVSPLKDSTKVLRVRIDNSAVFNVGDHVLLTPKDTDYFVF